MLEKELVEVFDKLADSYDEKQRRTALIRDALHFLIEAAFSSLPSDANVLCVGAGTGAEIVHLAKRFPKWTFTAVEPSGAMLDVCRRRMEEQGLTSRCVFHEGYLDTLESSRAFDAALSLLVSHFLLQRDTRVEYYRSIAERLGPTGVFVDAALAGDQTCTTYPNLLEVWLPAILGDNPPDEEQQRVLATYGRDVALLPVGEVSGLLESAGFEPPALFYQAGLVHAWYCRRA